MSFFSWAARSVPGATTLSMASSTSAGEHGVGGGELAVQVVQGAGADERAGHAGVRGDEAERELDQREASSATLASCSTASSLARLAGTVVS